MVVKLMYIGFIWAAYCALHSYLISIGFTASMKTRLKDYFAFYRIVYVILSFILLVPVLYYTRLWASPVIFEYGTVISVIRYGLMATGALIFIKAFLFDYDFLTFAGIRQILQFRRPVRQAPPVLKNTGLLGLVRHPLYLGVILIIWSNTHRLSDIVVNTVLTAYIFIGIILEEKKLVLEFGDAYRQYQKEIPMIVPFLRL